MCGADLEEHRMVRAMAASRAQHAQDLATDQGARQAVEDEEAAIMALAMEVRPLCPVK